MNNYGFLDSCAQCALGGNQSKPVLKEESSLRLINFLQRKLTRVFISKWRLAKWCLTPFMFCIYVYIFMFMKQGAPEGRSAGKPARCP